LAPKGVFAPEDQPELVARVGEGGVMRIVRPAHEVEAGFLDELYIAPARRLRNGDSPAAVILVRVDAAEGKMLAIEEEAAVGSPFEPADAESAEHFVNDPAIVDKTRGGNVQIRMIGMPELWIGQDAVLIRDFADTMREATGRFKFGDASAFRI